MLKSGNGEAAADEITTVVKCFDRQRLRSWRPPLHAIRRLGTECGSRTKTAV
jgi:hypothetical protein